MTHSRIRLRPTKRWPPLPDSKEPDYLISYKTVEYLSVLVGQASWGNQERRAAAAYELGQVLGTKKLESSDDCFDPFVREIKDKKK